MINILNKTGSLTENKMTSLQKLKLEKSTIYQLQI